MDDIRRKSPVIKDEYRNKYLKTLRYSPKSTVIDAVEPIRPAINQLNNPKPSLMFNIDILYERVNDFYDAFKKLNDRENKLRDLIKAFKEDPEEFLGQIMELIKQFNQTTASVLTFDRAFQTRYSETLSDLLARQQFNLEKAGIRIVGVNQLEFNSAFFKKAVKDNDPFFNEIFLPNLTLFDNALKIISGIRIPVAPPPNRNHAPASHKLQTSRIDQKV